MLTFARVVMSLLGAAAAPALVTGLATYAVMRDGVSAVDPLFLAQSVLSQVFILALVVAAVVGGPIFIGLHKRDRLRAIPVALAGLAAGFVVVSLVMIALHGPTGILGWLWPAQYGLVYLALGPFSALTALFVWRTFPGAQTATAGTERRP